MTAVQRGNDTRGMIIALLHTEQDHSFQDAMNTQNPGDKTLEQMPADRSLVNRLYRNGLISPRARREALDLLYPRTGWAWWIMVTLYAIGTSLFLTGAFFSLLLTGKRFRTGRSSPGFRRALFCVWWGRTYGDRET